MIQLLDEILVLKQKLLVVTKKLKMHQVHIAQLKAHFSSELNKKEKKTEDVTEELEEVTDEWEREKEEMHERIDELERLKQIPAKKQMAFGTDKTKRGKEQVQYLLQ